MPRANSTRRARGRALPSLAALLVAAACAAPAARAAQIVALDLKPSGGLKAELAEALNPLLITELAKREGMSVISQADVRALLEHESDKASLGCTDASCMTDIAGSMGAELLVSSTVSRVGSEWVVALSLIQVDGAQVIRRATGRAQGDQRAATDAVVAAVHELFRSGLPSELLGPASLSRRGFEAALAGLRRAILERATSSGGQEAKRSRKRVVLDIVNTELDYDAAPKLDMLQREIMRGRAEAMRLYYGSKTKDEADHYRRATEMYVALQHDHGRVKEIRERARERGLVPSARPLRFEDPEPGDAPTDADVARYFTEMKAARQNLARMLKALERGDERGYLAAWSSSRRESSAKSDFESKRRYAAENKLSFEVLHPFGHPPHIAREGVESLEREKRIIYALQRRNGQPDSERRVTLVKEGDQWLVDYW